MSPAVVESGANKVISTNLNEDILPDLQPLLFILHYVTLGKRFFNTSSEFHFPSLFQGDAVRSGKSLDLRN